MNNLGNNYYDVIFFIILRIYHIMIWYFSRENLLFLLDMLITFDKRNLSQFNFLLSEGHIN